jgi:preprotein translocase subunit SecE
MSKITEYFAGARSELKKVQWPTRQETTRHTIAVIAISLGVSAFLGAFDLLFNKVLEILIS